MSQRISRVKSYQYKFREGVYDLFQWKTIETLQNYDAVQNYLKSTEALNSEEAYIMDLEHQLELEFWSIIMTKATPQQIKVAQLYLSGMTQTEIATEMGIHQTSVQKHLKGSFDYKYHTYVGGLRQKLIKNIKASRKIQQLMKQIYQTDTDYHTPHFNTFKRIFTYQEFYSWLERDMTA